MSKQYVIKDVTEAKSGLVVYKDYYWLCVAGDPKKALFYGGSPQCNKDRRVPAYMLINGSYADRTDLQIVFIETAFVPQRK